MLLQLGSRFGVSQCSVFRSNTLFAESHGKSNQKALSSTTFLELCELKENVGRVSWWSEALVADDHVWLFNSLLLVSESQGDYLWLPDCHPRFASTLARKICATDFPVCRFSLISRSSCKIVWASHNMSGRKNKDNLPANLELARAHFTPGFHVFVYKTVAANIVGGETNCRSRLPLPQKQGRARGVVCIHVSLRM